MEESLFKGQDSKMKPAQLCEGPKCPIAIWTPVPALTEIVVGYLYQHSSFRPRGVETLSELGRVEGGVVLWVIPTPQDFEEVLLWMQSRSLSQKVLYILWFLAKGILPPPGLASGMIVYLGREIKLEKLVSLLSRLTRGGKGVPKGFCDGFQEEQMFWLGKEAVFQKGRISPRQKQILLGVALGLANKQIAQRLKISEETVKSYLRNLERKFKTSNRAGLAVSALLRGILPSQDLLNPKPPYRKEDRLIPDL